MRNNIISALPGYAYFGRHLIFECIVHLYDQHTGVILVNNKLLHIIAQYKALDAVTKQMKERYVKQLTQEISRFQQEIKQPKDQGRGFNFLFLL